MRSYFFRRLVFVCVVCVLVCPHGLAWAFDDEPEPAASSASIESMSISVKVRGRLATTTMDLVFASTRDDAQGILQWRMAPDAVVHDLVLWVEGLRIPCEVCPRAAARATYDRIVAGRRDPAIVEYLGNGVWNLSVFPVSPGKARKVRVVYSQMLPCTDAAVYAGPRITKDSPCRKVGMMEFEAEIECPGGVKDFTPCRKMGIFRECCSTSNSGKVVAGFRTAEWDSTESIWLKYKSIMPLPRMLSAPASPGGKDPNAPPDHSRVCIFDPNVPDAMHGEAARGRNIVLVLDTSGSMAGESWKAASSAANRILRSLTRHDRFNVIVCGPEPRLWESKLISPTTAKIDQAIRMIEKIEPAGGTDLAGALRAAASFDRDGQPVDILVISDGYDHVAARRSTDAPDANDPNEPVPPGRVFVLGVRGRTKGLDDLARTSGGAAFFIHEPLAASTAVPLLMRQLRRRNVADVRVVLSTKNMLGMNHESPEGVVHTRPADGWPSVIGWTKQLPTTMNTIKISAVINGRWESEAYSTASMTEPDPNSLTSEDQEAIRRIHTHLTCQAEYAHLQKPKARVGDLERLLALCKRRHIASTGSALLVLEFDEQFRNMGLSRQSTVLIQGEALSSLNKGWEFDEAQDPVLIKHYQKIEGDVRSRLDGLLAEGKLEEAANAADSISTVRGQTPKFTQYMMAFWEFVEFRRQQRRQDRREQAYRESTAKPWYEAAAKGMPTQLAPTAARFAVDVTTPMTQAEMQQRAGLGAKAPAIELKQTELSDAIDKLEQETKLDIQVRWPVLKFAGIDRDTKLDVSFNGGTAKDAVEALLSAVKPGTQLSYILDDEAVIISTKADLPGIPLTRVYDLRPILCGLPCYSARHAISMSTGGYGGTGGDGIFDDDSWGSGGSGLFGGSTSGGGGSGIFGDDSSSATDGGSEMLTLAVEDMDEPGSAFVVWRKIGKTAFRVDRIDRDGHLPRSEELMEDPSFMEYEYYRWALPPHRFANLFPTRIQVATGIVGKLHELASPKPMGDDFDVRGWCSIIDEGLLAVRDSRATQTMVARVIAGLNDAARNGKLTDAYLPHWPESIFSRQATIEPWVAELLAKAGANELTSFSSARIEDLPGRRMVRIGGIWLDATLTAEAKIYTVARTSPAGLAVKKALGDRDECFSLIGPVIIPAGAGMAVCLDRAGIRDEKDPDLKRLLAALKAKTTTQPAP